ncbi:Inosine/uridine-preferring nucleoside hydrolase domain protein [Metarhizium album ARSEF 1941]|uniref:Inosine/uridine-preferring nucleoside hydrolase domain protein n=1 Tax=Metarhizium album (strain ARSEF 1941) TaxID=1081103 RepID=A0A0B2WVD1_METAS|nr:Inosine/uridine-preferring nucleoside hydrolase domain protein [Metarhizium album ARSEF 1941]KHO00072.1 Inosine/uridine-preferring nucleoside hydrolase domain protein [Metarhizium album ARSEF 1941]
MAPQKIIIDTDPGVDDVMAMLLALSASPEELEVAMLSVTYGNVPLQSCLRNVVTMFHVLEKELQWRKSTGRAEGFEAMKRSKPIVAVGPEHSLEDNCLMADYFHGLDGLHNVHEAHPHLCPADTWKALFQADAAAEAHAHSPFFTPSREPAHEEILRILRENPVDTVSICAVGPLTNVALAAAEDPETFLRVKELVVMGGAVNVEGNITPVAEFNCYADTVAAARVYALTSYNPASTMPPAPEGEFALRAYPEKLSRQLRLTLAPLDITTPHLIKKHFFAERIQPYIDAGSPLATWTSHFIKGALSQIEKMRGDGSEPGLSLHDPLTIWYMLTHDDPKWKFPAKLEDIRVETSGQWTRGMHVVDKRLRSRPAELAALASPDPRDDPSVVDQDEAPGDTLGWLSVLKGNRVNRLIGSPGEDIFKDVWMERVFA